VYTANRLDLGKGLVKYVSQNLSQLTANVPLEFQNDSMVIGGACPYDMTCGADFPGIVGDGIWICHNLFMQARYAADDEMLRSTVFPMLKGMVNFHRRHLTTNSSTDATDATLHLPHSASPEYPAQNKAGIDTNFDIALLEWGLRTLLWTDRHLDLASPEAPTWSDELARLTRGPVDPVTGSYMVDSETPFAVLHRHFSHAFHIYPLHLITYDQGATMGGQAENKNNSLIKSTLDNWLHYTCKEDPVWSCPNGYTFTGASSMSSLIGTPDRREAAVGNLTAFLTSPEVGRQEPRASDLTLCLCILGPIPHALLVYSWSYPSRFACVFLVLSHRCTIPRCILRGQTLLSNLLLLPPQARQSC
jgi:hypothetical protein